jgi:hypothetical protein
VVAAGVRPDLIGGDHEQLVLDRARPHEDLPVVARRRQRERGRQRHDARPAQRERAEELGEAQVVADRQSQLHPAGELAQDDLRAGLRDGGLAVGAPRDLDVEHVQLAVGRVQLPLGIDVHGGVRQGLAGRRPVAPVLAGPVLPRTGSACAALDDRAGDEIYAQLARQRLRPLHRGSCERLRACAEVLVAPEQRPLLGEYDQSCPLRRGGAREAICRRQVGGLIRSGIELDCRDLQMRVSLREHPFTE